MTSKALIWIFMVIGSTIFGFIPSLWGADIFSPWSLVLGTVGGMLGIYVGFKLSR